jgi:F420H(2)-dependent quinone reductase
MFLRLAVNPVVRRLLRSRWHARLSGALALLTYRGARSGREYTIPVQYAEDERGRYVLVPGGAEHKRWWRNLREPAPVHLLVAGRDVEGVGRVLADPAEAEAAKAVFLRRFPRAARALEGGAVVVVRVEPPA